MIFNSITYIVFLIIVVVLYWNLPRKMRLWMLFIASLLFYGFWRVEFISILMLSTVTDYWVARLLDKEQRKQREEIGKERRSQVGGAERAEKVRTYNFPQNRVTDHRIGLTLHNLSAILQGDLDDLVDALAAQEGARKLEEAAVESS